MANNEYYGYDYQNRRRKRNSHGPHGLWFNPDQQNYDKFERPYSYSAFFLLGNHESIEGSSADYTDRYAAWGVEKFREALAAMGDTKKSWARATIQELDKFVKSYYGEEYIATGLVEWCNASNGYPCWSIHFKKKEG